MAVLSRLGGGAAAVTLGLFPVLAGLGLIETEGRDRAVRAGAGRAVGGVFVTIGAVLIANPLLGTARAHGAVTWRDATRLGFRQLLRRPTVASGGAALGVLPLAVGYWLGVSGITVGWLGGADGLRALVIIEFLVIHGFPFLVMAAWFARHTRGRARVVAGAALTLLMLLYGAMAWKAVGGVGGLLALLYLIMPNVLAFAMADAPVSARVLVTSRWVIKFGLLVLTTAILGGESFAVPETIRVGAVYFTLLAGAELLRVVEVPGELAHPDARGS